MTLQPLQKQQLACTCKSRCYISRYKTRHGKFANAQTKTWGKPKVVLPLGGANMIMHKLAAIFLVLASQQTTVAEERWIALGQKGQEKFLLDTASVIKNGNVRMNADIREAQVRIKWSDADGGYDQLDSTLLFDCDQQFFGNGEDKFRLDGALVKHLVYPDFQLHKVTAGVTVKAWETVCEKTFDRTETEPLQWSRNESTRQTIPRPLVDSTARYVARLHCYRARRMLNTFYAKSPSDTGVSSY